MTDQISTGVTRLDDVLHGGLLRHGINLITGVPGSGKTILSQQVVFHNATTEQPALYLTTLSEPLDKILRYGQSLKFFDRSALNDRRVIYQDVSQQIREGGLDELLAAIDRHVKEFHPGLVVIDSLRSLRTMSDDGSAYRTFLYGLLRQLTASATTSIWNAPYARAQVLEEPEAAVADAIIALDIKQIAEREARVLQVLKLRGSDYRSGEHMYRISADGLMVFPRLAESRIDTPYALSETHSDTGIAALDELLADGGYWSGATTLVAGPSGIGKTLMGLHFLFRGAQTGQPGVLATFQENPTQLDRIVRSFGWSIDDPNVRVMSRGLVDMNIDQWVYELMDEVEKIHARRVVIDSLLDVAVTAVDEIRFREWMFSLTQRFTRLGVSLMLIVEVAELFELKRISEQGISHLADNVILLQYVQEESELLRVLTVLKTRAMRHHPTVRRFEITGEGFVLGAPLSIVR